MYQSVNFSQTSNAITNRRIIDASTGRTISQPVNTDGNYSFNFWGGFGFKLKKLDLRMEIGPNANYNHSTDIINTENNTSKYLNAGFNVYMSKTKDKKYDLSLSNNFSYNSNTTQQYNQKIKYRTNELNLDATVYAKKVWSLKTDFHYYLRQKTPQFQDNLNNELWNARAQRTFKNNEFTVYFTVKDILNQNTGIERSFNSNTLSEVRNERLRRYWMLGFAWDFKNKQAKAPAKEQP